MKPINILVAIFSEKESHSVFLLNKFKIGRLDVVTYLSHGPKETKEDPIKSGESDNVEQIKSSSENDYLINLNNLVKDLSLIHI